MSIKTRVDKLEALDGGLILLVIPEEGQQDEAVKKYHAEHGELAPNSRVLFVITGVTD